MPTIVTLGLFYAALCLGAGASLPFMPVWFKAQGLSGAQIGVILAAPAIARTIVGPALALWADGFRLRRTPIIWLSVASAAVYGVIGLLHGFWGWLAAWLVGSVLFAMATPLGDVIALRRAGREGFAYAWPRSMGSVAYVFANVAMGVVLRRAPVTAVLVWMVVATMLTALAARLLPAERVHEAARAPPRADLVAGLGSLLRDPTFMLAIGAIGLIQASHGFYYGFSTLLWRRQGLTDDVIGLLWGAGVAVEVMFLWFMEPFRRWLGPGRLLILGGVGATARWSLLALSPGLGLLFALQVLHALSFSATFLASLRLIERLSPPNSASAAQTLNSVISGGLMTGLVTLAAGPIFDAWGFKGYYAMAGLAGLGLIGALMLSTRLARA